MELKVMVSYVLCPDCDACPTVEIYENEVRIGEEDNRVTLNRQQWNDLVQAIRRGDLGEVECDCGCAEELGTRWSGPPSAEAARTPSDSRVCGARRKPTICR